MPLACMFAVFIAATSRESAPKFQFFLCRTGITAPASPVRAFSEKDRTLGCLVPAFVAALEDVVRVVSFGLAGACLRDCIAGEVSYRRDFFGAPF